MTKNNIKYPIAYNKLTKELVNISDVTEHNKTHLICKDCEGVFISYLNHKTPHFKHKSITNCEKVESYIHWVTKEVFRNIDTIKLPKIFKTDLTETQRKELKTAIDNLINDKVPETLHIYFWRNFKKNITENIEFKIDEVEIEKPYTTRLGNIKVDIVANINNQELFIEPYFTNPIDNLKKEKLIQHGTPTIAINLVLFIEKFGYGYTIENLTKYLISIEGKSWVYFRENQIKNHISKYLGYVKEEIEKNKNIIEKHNTKTKEIVRLKKELKILEDKIKPTVEKISDIREDIWNLEKEIKH